MSWVCVSSSSCKILELIDRMLSTLVSMKEEVGVTNVSDGEKFVDNVHVSSTVMKGFLHNPNLLGSISKYSASSYFSVSKLNLSTTLTYSLISFQRQYINANFRNNGISFPLFKPKFVLSITGSLFGLKTRKLDGRLGHSEYCN